MKYFQIKTAGQEALSALVEEDEVKSLEVGNLNGNESKANGKEAQSKKSKRKM